MYSSDEAKMTGMTPAWLILSGMYVDAPPYIRRPTIRLAYWIGIRRCACSIKATNAMTATRHQQHEREHVSCALVVVDLLAAGRARRR